MYKKVKAYVDGSYDKKKKVYGSGIVMLKGDTVIKRESFKGNDRIVARSYQVGGELRASMKAILFAVRNKYDEITIYYDYDGIEKWATGEWRTNKDITKKYAKFISQQRSKIKIKFMYVKSHSDNKYNNLADKLAKNACKL